MTSFWAQFLILYAAALVGAAALTPFASRLIKSSAKPLKLAPAALLLISFVQSAVIFAAVTALGLLAAHAVGLGAPVVAALAAGRAPTPALLSGVLKGVELGALGGLILAGVDLVLLPRLPAKLLDLTRETSLFENFAACFYGGVDEELLTRLLGMSGVAWLIARLWHTPSGAPTQAGFWTANIAMAVLFGLGHLPATRNLLGRITPLVLARALALNGVIGVLCGWLFWRYGIEAAIAAHFSADIVYHVGGTELIRLNDRRGFLPGFPARGAKTS
jgi:hypothetical protein